MQVSFRGGDIHYKIEGQGPVIVFLHGFMENARIWKSFVPKFTDRFRVLRINLPGHGKTSVYGESHTMEFMAECVKAVLDHEKVEKAALVGHSMGGYVSLAFAEAFPESTSGVVMFSSSCFEDTPERKADRERAMKAADAHKMKFITSVIPNLFYERSGMKASKKIFKLVKIAAKQPKEGIIAAIRGMKDREDRSEIIRNAAFPLMFIAGQDDMLIPLERIQEMHRLQPAAMVEVLENCGHVGFFEQKKASIQAIRKFALEKIL